MQPNDPYNQQTPPPQAPIPGYNGYATPAPQPTPTYAPPQSSSWNGVTPSAPQMPQPLSQPQQYPTPPPRQITPTQSFTPPPRAREYGKAPLPVRIAEWFQKKWWIPVVSIIALVILGDIGYQVMYPVDALPPGTVVDGMKLGGMKRPDAVAKLNMAYGNVQTNLYFGDASVPYKTPKAKELGIQADNTARLAGVSYPVWLRVIPSSLAWASSLNKVGNPTYNYDKPTLDVFVQKNIGNDCVIPPKNASLKLDDNKFTVISAEAGGKCSITDFKNAASQAAVKAGTINIRTDIKKVDAPLGDAIARQLGDELNHNMSADLALQAGGKTTTVAASIAKSWLSFKAVIPEADTNGKTPQPYLLYTIEPDRVRKYFDTTVASQVETKPGVTKISTTDFTETSHVDGTPGVLIDIDKTIANINQYVAGRAGKAMVITGKVPPTVSYTRKYTPSDAGYRALIQQFAQDNPGKIGIALREVSGKKPWLSGAVNADVKMPAAGIEGAYVAYVAEMGVEDGTIQPTDPVAGSMSVTECVEIALKEQDRDCINGLLKKVGNTTAEARIHAIGLNSTSFSTAQIMTTANDMLTFIAKQDDNTLGIRQSDKIRAPMRNINQRDGFLTAVDGIGLTIGGSDETHYNEAGAFTKNGKYYLSLISQDSESGKTAAKLLKAVQELRAAKQALKSGN